MPYTSTRNSAMMPNGFRASDFAASVNVFKAMPMRSNDMGERRVLASFSTQGLGRDAPPRCGERER